MTGTRKQGLRVLSAVLCFACFLSNAQPAAAVSAPEPVSVSMSMAASEHTSQTMTTVVRLKANSASNPIGQMENGTKVTVLGKKGNYYKVDCYDMKGYILKSQIVHTKSGEYYIDCKADSSETRMLTYTDHVRALMLRNSLFSLAKEQLGSKYVYGGSRPGAFDCSGLTSYLFSENGIDLSRSAATQLQDGVIIPKEALQVGDLVFFYEPGRHYPASHVGIYVGNNQMIHSASKGVEYRSLDSAYYAKYFLCARRIINTSIEQTVSDSLAVNSVSGRVIN